MSLVNDDTDLPLFCFPWGKVLYVPYPVLGVFASWLDPGPLQSNQGRRNALGRLGILGSRGLGVAAVKSIWLMMLLVIGDNTLVFCEDISVELRVSFLYHLPRSYSVFIPSPRLALDDPYPESSPTNRGTLLLFRNTEALHVSSTTFWHGKWELTT